MKRQYENEQAWYGEFKNFVDCWNTSVGDDYLGDKPFDKFLYVEEAESWEDFLEWSGSLRDRWGFRGQSRSTWALHPSIYRSLIVQLEAQGISSYQQLHTRHYEDEMLFRFQQQAHQHRNYLPGDSDLMSWLAMMQHHGAPTRLLDWSRSPYVAAYFAVEDETKKAAIWAIDLDWLEERGNAILQSTGRKPMPTNPSERAAFLNELLGEKENNDDAPRMVVRVEPRRTDAWMTSQRGFFLCKCWDRPTLNELVMRMMIHPELVPTPRIRKLEIGSALRFDFLRELQAANIHRGSLFPDLDGFSRSLNIDLRIKMDRLRQQYEEQYQGQARHRASTAEDDDSDGQDE